MHRLLVTRFQSGADLHDLVPQVKHRYLYKLLRLILTCSDGIMIYSTVRPVMVDLVLLVVIIVPVANMYVASRLLRILTLRDSISSPYL